MAGKKRKGAKAGAKGAKVGARLGAKVAPKAGKAAGKTAWKAGKAQARLVRHAASSREPRGVRFVKYGFFALAGLAIGALIARSSRDGDASSSYTDAGSPAGQGGTTWGSGTPTGTTHQRPEDDNRTGAERDYSDPASGPLIGEQHRGDVEGVPEQQEEVEQRIRTRIGEDPRTADMPRLNVEVNDGVAELRGVASSESQAQAAGEIAQGVEGVRSVQNMINVS